jgi:hypothetical protein
VVEDIDKIEALHIQQKVDQHLLLTSAICNPTSFLGIYSYTTTLDPGTFATFEEFSCPNDKDQTQTFSQQQYKVLWFL